MITSTTDVGLFAGMTLIITRALQSCTPLPHLAETLSSKQVELLLDRVLHVGCTPTSDLATHGTLILPSTTKRSNLLSVIHSIARRKKRKVTVVTGLKQIDSGPRPPPAADALWCILHEFQGCTAVPKQEELGVLCCGVVDVVTSQWLFASLDARSQLPVDDYLLGWGNGGVSRCDPPPSLVRPPPTPVLDQQTAHATPAGTSTLGWWYPPPFLGGTVREDQLYSPFRDFASSPATNQHGPCSALAPSSPPIQAPGTGGFFPVFFGSSGQESEQRATSGPALSVFMTDRMKRQLDYIDRKQVFAVQKSLEAEAEDEHGNVSHSSPESRVDKDFLGRLNEDIVEELAKLKSVYEATGDQWRKYAYNRAIGLIKRWPTRIQSADELRHCQGLGDKILNKIDEIIKCGTTNKLTYLRGQSYVQASEELVKVWGISSATAKKISMIPFHRLERALRARGQSVPPTREYAFTSVEDVRRHPPAFLSPQQRVGLQFFEDLMVRIPREEVEAIRGVVMGALRRLGIRVNPNTEASMRGDAGQSNGEEGVDMLVCGSYRRGKPSSGDVDVLICDRSGRHCDGLLKLLVEEMRRGVPSTPTPKTDAKEGAHAVGPTIDRARFVVAELTVSYKSSHEVAADTWFGIVQVPACSGNCPCGHRGTPPTVHTAQSSSSSAPPVNIGVKRARSPNTAKPENTSSAAAVKEEGVGEDSDVEVVGEAGVDGSEALEVAPRPITAFKEGVHYGRRLDIKVYNAEHFPFAVLYFTGSDYFNRSMRLYAQKRGMSLSDKGLTHVVRATTGKKEKIHEGRSEECRTEREVFDRLGLPYRRPHERDL